MRWNNPQFVAYSLYEKLDRHTLPECHINTHSSGHSVNVGTYTTSRRKWESDKT